MTPKKIISLHGGSLDGLRLQLLTDELLFPIAIGMEFLADGQFNPTTSQLATTSCVAKYNLESIEETEEGFDSKYTIDWSSTEQYTIDTKKPPKGLP